MVGDRFTTDNKLQLGRLQTNSFKHREFHGDGSKLLPYPGEHPAEKP